jgi:glucose/arabinose dehydrogenase
MNADGSGFEIFASGIRNTVGFDWDPATGNLWFSENGRDLMGDDLPPDEINVAPQRGLHFGFPYIHGREIPDPKYGNTPPKIRMIPPAMELGPHVAALGMRFYRGRMFPEAYRGRIFIAEHGSWNRSDPIGYRITMATVSQGTASGYFTFAEGWLEGDNAWGRPADVEIAPDGSLYVSDDKAGAIYRISYEQP